MDYDLDAATPVVTLSSSSRDDLLGEWGKFYIAVDKAMEAFPHESFHGRNQQPEDKLNASHTERSLMLGELDDLRQLALNVLEKLNHLR